MRSLRFTVVEGPHSRPGLIQWAIQRHDLTAVECSLIERIVCNQWSDSKDYAAMRPAHPFLQGFHPPSEEDGADGWCLVEFWTDNRVAIDAAVAHINSEFAKEAA